MHLPTSAAQITPHSVVLADGRELAADLVVISAGVKANLEVAQAARSLVEAGAWHSLAHDALRDNPNQYEEADHAGAA